MKQIKQFIVTLAVLASIILFTNHAKAQANTPVLPPPVVVATPPSVSTNAAGQVTVPPSFISTAEGYFMSFNTNLASTFALSGETTNRGQFWTGATLANNINLGQEIGASYYPWTGKPISLEAQALNTGVFNTIESAEFGVGYSIIIVDTRVSLIADVGTRFSPSQVFGAGHIRLEKAASAHTFFGLDAEIQSGGKTDKVPMLTAFTGFTF